MVTIYTGMFLSVMVGRWTLVGVYESLFIPFLPSGSSRILPWRAFSSLLLLPFPFAPVLIPLPWRHL